MTALPFGRLYIEVREGLGRASDPRVQQAICEVILREGCEALGRTEGTMLTDVARLRRWINRNREMIRQLELGEAGLMRYRKFVIRGHVMLRERGPVFDERPHLELIDREIAEIVEKARLTDPVQFVEESSAPDEGDTRPIEAAPADGDCHVVGGLQFEMPYDPVTMAQESIEAEWVHRDLGQLGALLSADVPQVPSAHSKPSSRQGAARSRSVVVFPRSVIVLPRAGPADGRRRFVPFGRARPAALVREGVRAPAARRAWEDRQIDLAAELVIVAKGGAEGLPRSEPERFRRPRAVVRVWKPALTAAAHGLWNSVGVWRGVK